MVDYRDHIIRTSAERDTFMADRLRRFYNEQDAKRDNPGLNDLRKMTREASRDETAAMAVIGWIFVIAVGIGLGTLFAYWLTGDVQPVISAIRGDR